MKASSATSSHSLSNSPSASYNKVPHTPNQNKSIPKSSNISSINSTIACTTYSNLSTKKNSGLPSTSKDSKTIPPRNPKRTEVSTIPPSPIPAITPTNPSQNPLFAPSRLQNPAKSQNNSFRSKKTTSTAPPSTIGGVKLPEDSEEPSTTSTSNITVRGQEQPAVAEGT
mgnify:CR=1 FL=1